MQLGNLLLESTPRLCAEISHITKSVNKIALTSYNTTSWKDGTIGQIEEITQLMQRRDRLEDLVSRISTALSGVDKPLRQLLSQVYIVRRKPKELAQKYNVSPTTVYNKLSAGKKIFCANLKSTGVTCGWVKENFDDLPWLCKLADECDESALISKPRRRKRVLSGVTDGGEGASVVSVV